MSKLSQFGKFVSRYAGEIRSVAGLFTGLFQFLPIDPADKRRLQETIDGLAEAADRIESSLPGLLDGNISRDDIRDVLREILPEILPDMIGGRAETVTRQAVAPRPARVRKPAVKKATRLPTAAETTGD